MKAVLIVLTLSLLSGCEYVYQPPENLDVMRRAECIEAGFPGDYKMAYVRKGHHALRCLLPDGTGSTLD